MSQQSDSKNFSLVVKTVKAYQIVSSLFTKTSLWFSTFSLSNLLSATARILSFSTSTLVLGILELDISVSSISNALSSISLASTISAVASLIYGVSASIKNSLVISYVLREIATLSASMTVTQPIVFTIVTAIFNTLGDYDAGTLLTIDTDTLGVLDYTAT